MLLVDAILDPLKKEFIINISCGKLQNNIRKLGAVCLQVNIVQIQHCKKSHRSDSLVPIVKWMVLNKSNAQTDGLINYCWEEFVFTKALKRRIHGRVKETFIPNSVCSTIAFNQPMMH